MRRIEPHFPLSHGLPRVDDQRVISGIIFVIRNGLRWRVALKAYGPHKTIYNRFIRWTRLGVFNRIFSALTAKAGKPDQLMIDATHLKAHRTAASLFLKVIPWRSRKRQIVLGANDVPCRSRSSSESSTRVMSTCSLMAARITS